VNPTNTSSTLNLHQVTKKFRAENHVRDLPNAASGNEDKSKATLRGCWCVSKGMAGMNSQTSGLAKAVGFEFDFEFKNTRLAFPWNCLPMSWVPWSNRSMQNAGELIAEPAPKLVVSCGRHGIIPALFLKKKLGDAVFTVHIQDPKINTSGFDLVVIPKHDETRAENVYLTTGALHYVTPEKLAQARASEHAALFRECAKPICTVLLGGKNRYYAFSKSDVERLILHLDRVSQQQDVKFVFLKSNRSPEFACDRIQERFGDEHIVWDGTGHNPYFEALACSSYVVVTGDSVSMVTEATATGCPVYVQHLTERRPAPRFRRFHEMFEKAGYTRKFDGRLDDWSYEPPNDTPKVAELIRDRMGISK
jgi:mitochondrial fission protein ELM1